MINQVVIMGLCMLLNMVPTESCLLVGVRMGLLGFGRVMLEVIMDFGAGEVGEMNTRRCSVEQSKFIFGQGSNNFKHRRQVQNDFLAR